ncbi:MAG TPA: 3-deoxy-7-phosphoheptulonate synthase [Acidobacteriaceae bacterium]
MTNAAVLNATVLEVVTSPERKGAASRLTERCYAAQATVVHVGNVAVGGGAPVVIAGPCSVESREQLMTAAQCVKAAGATLLRGGAYKPRTSPYDFQGLGLEALLILREASELTGLPVVSEVMSTDDIEVVSDHVAMLQVGARNMQNFALLRRLGKLRKPVLLKRSPAATVKEWLLAAEYILAGGNEQVVLCERGIRSYDPELRNTFDIGGMVLAKTMTHLPVIADPSHATGRRDLVPALSRAALAAGADGLIVEVHPQPEEALSDGAQSLDPEGFAAMMRSLRPVLAEESSARAAASL